MIIISVSGLLTFSFLITYLILDWYTQEVSHETHEAPKGSTHENEVYCIQTNSDGTKDYSSLYADVVEERKKANRANVTVTNIEGTGVEDLFSSLQSELGSVEESSLPDVEPIGYQQEVHTSDIDSQEEPVVISHIIDHQERIYELRHRLDHLSKENGEIDIEAMIMTQYELFSLEGREDQVLQLKKDFFMYFPDEDRSRLEQYPSVHEKDILTMEDMDISFSSTTYSNNRSMVESLGVFNWRGRVIGKADKHIHFLNEHSRRVWIYAGDKIHKVQLDDELMLEVYKDEYEVTITKMIRLVKKDCQKKDTFAAVNQ